MDLSVNLPLPEPVGSIDVLQPGHERIDPAGHRRRRPPGRAAAARELTAEAIGWHSATSGQCA
jgi:hypothetical protein